MWNEFIGQTDWRFSITCKSCDYVVMERRKFLYTFEQYISDIELTINLYNIYMCECVYLGSISSLMQISLNIIDILCLHISSGSVRIPVLLLSYCIDRISDNNYIYVGLTSTTLSRRLTMHLSDTSSIAQHLKKHSLPNNTTTKNSHRQHNTRTSK